MDKIYLDSCIVIYLVEKHPTYFSIVRDRLYDAGEVQLAISPLMRLEVLVKPARDTNYTLLRHYETFLSQQLMLEIPAAVFDLALSLRAQYLLKAPDAIHLATAIYFQCQSFWTNDTRLLSVKNVKINVL